MCGICGELRFDNTSPQLDNLKRMTSVLARRGPDSEGYYQTDTVAFGHRRLSVIDLSERGTQPMVDNQHNLILVFNGTIYNYRELRHELIEKGYQFQSETDTEVILKAYAEWGDTCVNYLQGMFAFAIWDKTQQRLFLARDRVGIKPLYYVKTPEFIRFASTMPALLATDGINKQIDPIGLHHHLTLHAVIPAPYTILQGIRKVEPATSLSINKQGDIQRRVYWQLNATRPAETYSEQDWIELTHTALKNAVSSHRSVADVPVGVLLSGGLDSSLLVGLLAEHYDAHNLLTFSVGFEDAPEEKGSEFEYSDQIVARYKTRHHRYTIPNAQVLQRLPEAIQNMAEPMVGQDAVAFYLLAEQVSQTVKVVQSGQGADEVFGGYFWYPLMNAATGNDLDRFRPYYFDRTHNEFLETVHPDYHGEDYTAQTIANLLAQDNASEFLDKVLRMDVTTLIVDDPVKRVDNMTMAWGLEARVPFLDQQLLETAARMPPSLKMRENGKYPLKAIARKLLPASVIDRPKGYFPVPALKYVRGEFLTFMREVLQSDTCRQRQLFNRTYVDKLLANPEAYMTPLQGSKLWHLALLESWLQTHL
ncbi:asparagine synthase, glutamine-hydrolyzing [Beggiatoa alba B18LD]|uniref:asparagine synthase (glutamine-hydrolyzing) n=1 Tax=Beggiatoa alba B18LD TaxID=395493 RepID=I3CIH8_9GAMM|nr:N-acetylglutaminylglutamine amidotransferase [Beggiatoa alba]EIJ43421.1 asparagine synthase, glutamine-hydrolyzing [Beggiatoa alba B18LD]